MLVRPAQFDRKPVRYSLVSVVAVAASQLVLVICSGLLHWSPVPSKLAAVSIGSIPSYALNRMWVWGRRGRNDVWREVVPFWGFALLGLAFSTLLVHLAARWNDSPGQLRQFVLQVLTSRAEASTSRSSRMEQVDSLVWDIANRRASSSTSRPSTPPDRNGRVFQDLSPRVSVIVRLYVKGDAQHSLRGVAEV